MDETDVTVEYVDKDECNIELNIEEIEDISKEEKFTEVYDQKAKRENNEECQYDALEETAITKRCIIKEEFNVSLDIEEIEDISKVEKSREVEDSIIKEEGNRECQNDILDETNVTGLNKHKSKVRLNIEEIEDVSKEEKYRKMN